MTNTAQADLQDSQNVIMVNSEQSSVCCPPKEQAHWNQHPRVYLDLSSQDQVSCPYCGNQFQRQK